MLYICARNEKKSTNFRIRGLLFQSFKNWYNTVQITRHVKAMVLRHTLRCKARVFAEFGGLLAIRRAKWVQVIRHHVLGHIMRVLTNWKILTKWSRQEYTRKTHYIHIYIICARCMESWKTAKYAKLVKVIRRKQLYTLWRRWKRAFTLSWKVASK